MTEFKTLADGLAVTGQLQLADLPKIATQFRTLINNRPDGEESKQPASADLEAAARRLGLDYVELPVAGQIDDEQVAAFANALGRFPAPALAFCRTGRRSAALWALSQAGKRSPADLLAVTANAGYDLQSLKTRLLQAAPAR